MHLNVQSLVPKIDLLNVEFQKFDILCFTETWLNTNVANQDISLDNFQSPFRKDRVDRLGGRCCNLCEKRLPCGPSK